MSTRTANKITPNSNWIYHLTIKIPDQVSIFQYLLSSPTQYFLFFFLTLFKALLRLPTKKVGCEMRILKYIKSPTSQNIVKGSGNFISSLAKWNSKSFQQGIAIIKSCRKYEEVLIRWWNSKKFQHVIGIMKWYPNYVKVLIRWWIFFIML